MEANGAAGHTNPRESVEDLPAAGTISEASGALGTSRWDRPSRFLSA